MSHSAVFPHTGDVTVHERNPVSNFEAGILKLKAPNFCLRSRVTFEESSLRRLSGTRCYPIRSPIQKA